MIRWSMERVQLQDEVTEQEKKIHNIVTDELSRDRDSNPSPPAPPTSGSNEMSRPPPDVGWNELKRKQYFPRSRLNSVREIEGGTYRLGLRSEVRTLGALHTPTNAVSEVTVPVLTQYQAPHPGQPHD